MSTPTTPSGPPGPPASAPFDRRPRDLSAGSRACPCIQSTDVLKEEDDSLLLLSTNYERSFPFQYHFLYIISFAEFTFCEHSRYPQIIWS